MRNHPAKFYIVFLLCTLEKPSVKNINSSLRASGYVEIDQEYLEAIKKTLPKLPEEFRPWDAKHRPSRKWLTDVGIYKMLHPDQYINEMMDLIMSRPRVRESVERLALGNLSAAEISKKLSEKGYHLTDNSVANYMHYFWNSKSMSISDWTYYLEEDARTSPEKGTYEGALKGGPAVALYRLGIESEVDTRKVMQELQSELYHSFLEIKSLPMSTKKIEMLSAVTRSLTKIDERLQQSDSALTDVLKKFEKFKVKAPVEGFKSLGKIASKGSVSRNHQGDIIDD